MNLPVLRALPLALGALCLAGAACAATPATTAARATFLTQGEAAARSARIANVDYVLDFELSGKDEFSGTSTLHFDLSDTAAPITIDLNKATIGALTVNGVTVAPQYNQAYLTIAPQQLRAGRNTVAVSYRRAHSSNGYPDGRQERESSRASLLEHVR